MPNPAPPCKQARTQAADLVVDSLMRKLTDGLEGDLHAVTGACLLSMLGTVEQCASAEMRQDGASGLHIVVCGYGLWQVLASQGPCSGLGHSDHALHCKITMTVQIHRNDACIANACIMLRCQ